MRLRISLWASSASLQRSACSSLVWAPPLRCDEEPMTSRDPQTTNIPYLAWAGEEVKVVKCIGGADGDRYLGRLRQQSGHRSALLAGKFRVEDWSGVDEVHSARSS